MERTPVLLPQNRVTAQMVADWAAVYVACDGGGAFAFLIVEEGGETFVDELPGIRHVGKAYCEPGHRGSGAMPALLAAAQRDLAAQGIERLGVDCETLNPPAYRFWRRHFSAFTYSAVRRLDARLRRLETAPAAAFGGRGSAARVCSARPGVRCAARWYVCG